MRFLVSLFFAPSALMCAMKVPAMCAVFVTEGIIVASADTYALAPALSQCLLGTQPASKIHVYANFEMTRLFQDLRALSRPCLIACSLP